MYLQVSRISHYSRWKNKFYKNREQINAIDGILTENFLFFSKRCLLPIICGTPNIQFLFLYFTCGISFGNDVFMSVRGYLIIAVEKINKILQIIT